MNTDVTIKAEDFRDLHNSLCSLRSISRTLEGVIHPDHAQGLAKVVEDLERSLRGAYDQENQDFDRKSEHYDEVRKAIGAQAIWSLYEVEDLDQTHPWPDATCVRYSPQVGRDIIKVIGDNDTWRDLYAAADRCIRESGDMHHIFIESFRPDHTGHVLVLSTGS